MVSRTAGRPFPTRPGFTVIELLVAMALLVFIAVIGNQALTAGLNSFRDLKALGDLGEDLRQANTDLRRINQAAAAVVIEGFFTGSVDLEDVSDLRKRYEAIGASAGDLDDRLKAVARQTVNPADKRAIQRTREALAFIKTTAEHVAVVLRQIEDDGGK